MALRARARVCVRATPASVGVGLGLGARPEHYAPPEFEHLRAPKSKTPELFLARAVYLDISLTMSYFHTGTRTIIGAEAFHCPVRDGKEWDHLAMVIRLDLSPPCQ